MAAGRAVPAIPASRTPGTCTNCCSANSPKPPRPMTPIPSSLIASNPLVAALRCRTRTQPQISVPSNHSEEEILGVHDDRDKELHMYVPSHFAPDEAAVDELLARHGAADLVTATPDGLRATMLPFVYDRERRTLLGHFARNNDHWRQPVLGEALVIVRGPDSYISPSWYASKVEHGRVVPTWNYVTAHVHGALTVHDDVEWLAALVRRLTDQHEAGRPAPWSVDDAP